MNTIHNSKRINGQQIAQVVIDQVRLDVAEFKRYAGKPPGLAVILIGEDPASQVYVHNKIKRAAEVGILSILHRLPATTTQQMLNHMIDELNADPVVHGILVQLPLPASLNEADVIARIRADKDVDGFHPLNVGALACGRASLIPCTPLGCMIMLRETLGDITGKRAVVVGRSNIVGKPMANLLLQANCTVTLVHSRTQDIEAVCREADILIVAIGKAELINADWVKAGAVVIDVGINAIERCGKRTLVGDVDFESVASVAAAISPVPRGVGPMTIACLMKNTLTAAQALENISS